MTHSRLLFAALSIALLCPGAPALAGSASMKFYGTVSHVSADNIKVHNPTNGQTLSFVIVPKVTKVFKSGGKVTAEQKEIVNGTSVEIIYDQKALGIRHADQIILATSPNKPIKS